MSFNCVVCPLLSCYMLSDLYSSLRGLFFKSFMGKVSLKLNCDESVPVSWGFVMRKEGKSTSLQWLNSYVQFGSCCFPYFKSSM